MPLRFVFGSSVGAAVDVDSESAFSDPSYSLSDKGLSSPSAEASGFSSSGLSSFFPSSSAGFRNSPRLGNKLLAGRFLLAERADGVRGFGGLGVVVVLLFGASLLRRPTIPRLGELVVEGFGVVDEDWLRIVGGLRNLRNGLLR